jgi:hypothetical protein
MANQNNITYELQSVEPGDQKIVDSSNRYIYSSVYSDNNERFFELWDIPEIPLDPRDRYLTIESGEEGRWDLLSYKAYNTVFYWWLICLANDVTNPWIVIPAGNTIRIPYLPNMM